MGQGIILKVYDVDYSFIIKNYLDEKLWNKEWTIFIYKNFHIVLRLSSIDVRNKVIVFEVEIQDGNRENKSYWTKSKKDTFKYYSEAGVNVMMGLRENTASQEVEQALDWCSEYGLAYLVNFPGAGNTNTSTAKSMLMRVKYHDAFAGIMQMDEPGRVDFDSIANSADIINDVIVARSGRRCPMAELAAERGCPIVAVHNSRGEDCGENFFDFLMDGLSDIISFVENEGVPRSKIIIDPGFGFGKTAEQNFEILARLGELRKFGCAVLLGVSRKSSLAALVGESMDVRDAATVAVTAISSAMKSADIVRVHDVAKNAAAVKVAREILKWTK